MNAFWGCYLAAMIAGPAGFLRYLNTHPVKGTPDAVSEEDQRVDREGRPEGRPAPAEEVTDVYDFRAAA